MSRRRDLSFNSGGEVCAAWLYEPDGPGPHPLVILAHGFGGTREGRLGAYAERFSAAGFAAFVFDYRHFGDSGGEPRQLISIPRQHEDWRAALGFARTLEGVDRDRVALWGTSFSGGHVVVIGAHNPQVAAVISQAPFAEGLAALRSAGPGGSMRLAGAAVRDQLRALRGAEPYRIPVVAAGGQTAAMSQPGSYEGYLDLFSGPGEFRNEYCARVGLGLGFYSPLRSAPGLDCPLLVLTCGADAVTPPAPARRMADRAPLGRNIEYEGAGHFEIYVGELFERTIADQIAFLGESLGAGVDSPAA